MGLFGKILFFISCMLSFALAVSYISPYIPPSEFIILAILGLMHPWLLLANVIMVIFWMFRKKWFAFVFLLIILGGWTHIKGFVGLNLSTPTESKESVKIMSYNVARLYNIKDVNKRHDSQETFTKLADYLKNQKPDILCIGEMNEKYIDSLKIILKLPYVASTDNSNGTELLTIFSKYEILNSEDILFKNSYNANMFADIKIKKQTFRVFNIHLESNKITDLTHKFAQSQQDNKVRAEQARFILSRFRQSAIIRENQANVIAGKIKDSPFPVIVCGDFNDTPVSHTYHLLSKGLKDAFKAKGKGIGTTFAGNIPALKIDYILTDPTIEILTHKIDRALFSDHYPLSATVLLSN